MADRCPAAAVVVTGSAVLVMSNMVGVTPGVGGMRPIMPGTAGVAVSGGAAVGGAPGFVGNAGPGCAAGIVVYAGRPPTRAQLRKAQQKAQKAQRQGSQH